MKKLKTILCLLAAFSVWTAAEAQLSSVVTSWKINYAKHKAYDGTDSIITDVEAVYYDSTYSYIKTSGVPSYYNFTNNNGNVNAASDLKAVFKITRSPQQ